jgi:hypothetical protein
MYESSIVKKRRAEPSGLTKALEKEEKLEYEILQRLSPTVERKGP